MRRFIPMLVLLAACRSAPSDSARTSGSAAPFSREAFVPRASDGGVSEPPVPSSADPAALAEIVAAAPKASARAPTALDGGTSIGKETGLRDDPDGGDGAGIEARKTSKVVVGKVVGTAPFSDPAIEQALRAQVYHRLTLSCRAPDQGILPPEAVHIFFQIDGDGYLISPSILASPKEDRFAEAARCMARELGMITFRAPPAGRGRGYTINADVPSVD